jgi:hypothetical protein
MDDRWNEKTFKGKNEVNEGNVHGLGVKKGYLPEHFCQRGELHEEI